MKSGFYRAWSLIVVLSFFNAASKEHELLLRI